jgi:hypothetical protein
VRASPICRLLLFLLLGHASRAALAQSAPVGLNLSWNDCGAAGAANEAFACDVNTGSHMLVASFVSPTAVDSLSAIVGSLLITFPSWPPPSWWLMSTGGCRPTVVGTGASFDFSADHQCVNPWPSPPVGAFSEDVGFDCAVCGCGNFCALDTFFPECVRTHVNAIRLKGVAALPAPEVTSVPAFTEAYAFKFILSNRGTVGTACSGCVTGACIELNLIELDQSSDPSSNSCHIPIFSPSTRSRVTWNGGIAGCDAVTPARNGTWGAIKSLYR